MNGSIEYADLPDYTAFRNAITAEIADSIGTNPYWSELTVYVSDTPRDERYQYTVLLPKDKTCQYMVELLVCSKNGLYAQIWAETTERYR